MTPPSRSPRIASFFRPITTSEFERLRSCCVEKRRIAPIHPMKLAVPLFLSLVVFSTSVWSQDPKFREAQPSRPVVNVPPSTDDSNAAASRISSMEALDDSIPLRVGYRISLRIVE